MNDGSSCFLVRRRGGREGGEDREGQTPKPIYMYMYVYMCTYMYLVVANGNSHFLGRLWGVACFMRILTAERASSGLAQGRREGSTQQTGITLLAGIWNCP